MASVRKRSWTHAGQERFKWVVDYFDQKGKRRLQTFERKKDADAARIRIEAEIQAGNHVAKADDILMKDLCEQFIRNLEQRWQDGRIGQTHCVQGTNIIRKWLVGDLGTLRLSELSFTLVEDWYKSMRDRGLAVPTAKRRLYYLKEVEDFARKRGLTNKRLVPDVCREVGGNERAVIRTFTVEEVRALLEGADARPSRNDRGREMFRCFVYIAAFCGLRFGEIVALVPANVDLEKRVIRVRHSMTEYDEIKPPKTKAGIRNVPMPTVVAEIVEAYLQDHYPFHRKADDRDLIFRSATGKRIYPELFHSIYWRPLLRAVGLEKEGDRQTYHFHALRHFAASLMIEHGLKMPVVAALMGHARYDMTLQVYAHSISASDDHQHLAIESMAGIVVSETARRGASFPRPITIDATPET